MKGLFLGNGGVAIPSVEAYLDALGSENVTVVTKKYGCVENFAAEAGANVFAVSKGEQALQIISSTRFDVALIVSFGVIIPQDHLAGNNVDKFFNMHFSLLPAYRGAAPVQRSIMAGEDQFGVSLQKLSPKIDAGDIVMQNQFKFDETTMASEIFDVLSRSAATMVPDFLEKFKTAKLSFKPQQGTISKAPKIEKSDGLITHEISRLLAWRKYRALSEHPGVYVTGGLKKDKNIEPINIKIINMSQERQNPEDLHFVFPDGDLFVQTVRLPGKSDLQASDIRHGYSGKDGHPELLINGF